MSQESQESQKLPPRSEVPLEEQWDLTALFETREAYEEDLATQVPRAKEFNQKYEGKVALAKDASFIVSAIKDFEALYVRLMRSNVYAVAAYNVDMQNADLLKQSQANDQVVAEVLALISFLTVELAQTEAGVLEEAVALAPEYKTYITDILAYKPHQLSAETEKVLASLSNQLSLPDGIYNTIKFMDMKFPDFEADGKTWPLSYVAYENNYSGDMNTLVRRKAFTAFSETLGNYRHTTAAAYNGQVQKEKVLATLRGFDSVIDYLLFDQKVSRDMFDRQIDVIMTELAPHMRRYVKLLQKEHGLDELHYSDLKIVLDPDYSPKVTIEESKAYISDAVKVMGQEYHDLTMRSYEERWVDFAQNEGKSTGGFCITIPEVHPYILLNWNGDLAEVFTLAHELGHAVQGVLSFQNNSVLEAELTRYDVEAPSTFHEMLLTESLLKEDKGPRFKRWVLSSMISNTYYHNMVTHLLEACYQREVYRLVDAGETVQADTLDGIYRKVLEDFWGDTVILDEGAERTWMRQPHYYMGLYSYVYSASLTISTAMAMRLKAEGEVAAKDWLSYLKAGGPMAPLDHAKMVGIDLSTDKPLRDAISYIGDMVTEIERLTEELS